jgi:hypothetical protein
MKNTKTLSVGEATEILKMYMTIFDTPEHIANFISVQREEYEEDVRREIMNCVRIV